MMEFAFDILRATEAAAVAASDYIGCGDKLQADHAATSAMRRVLNNIEGFGAWITIGEGKKDNAPGLFKGETVGTGPIDWDVAVDPLDGTSQTAKGGPGAISVVAVGGWKHLFGTEDFYMKKLAYGPRIISAVRRIRDYKGMRMSLLDDLEEFLTYVQAQFVAERMTACVLDRPRHADDIKVFHKCGWRIKLIQDCDVSAAIGTAMPNSGIDLYYGIGGAPEGVIAAAAMKCLGGHFEGLLVDQNLEAIDGKLMQINDLAAGDVIFCATGVTTGDLLKGVHRNHEGILVSHSVLMESAHGKTYFIECHHQQRSK